MSTELDGDIAVDNSNGNGKQGRPLPHHAESVQLIKAFCGISRTETRQLIVKLVETMGASDQGEAWPSPSSLRKADVILRLVEIEATQR